MNIIVLTRLFHREDLRIMLRYVSICSSLKIIFNSTVTTKKDTSVTFRAERIFFCHTYDTSMMITLTKPGIIIDVVGSYFYDMTFFGPSMTEKTVVEARARKISGSCRLWWEVRGRAMRVSLVHVRACVRGVGSN